MSDLPPVLVYLVVCLVPAALWLWWIRRQDVYEPEPVSLILRTFASGMLAAVGAVLLEQLLIRVLISGDSVLKYNPQTGTLAETLIYCFLVVAPVEEYLKYRVVRSGAFESPEFNEPMDGIVYMSSAAIGFATLENTLYMTGFGAWVLALRMMLSSFLHIACLAILGYYLGLIRFNPGREQRLLWRGFFWAILLHGAYDFLALYQPIAGLGALMLLLTVLFFLRQRFLREIQQALARSPFKPRRTLLPRRGSRPLPAVEPKA
ncbi:MAG: PrsW family intramembrane metalloprotease [Candidatus Riflebacteria bacterium]|nr:PrsW family intramembrane metalloprotease [Candidatus Riflebacteria bacterium]